MTYLMTHKYLSYAKQLRQTHTLAEQRLWYYLRNRHFLGIKFRRQVPIGHYIADFICFEYRLIIEVDGGQHAEQLEYDEVRTQWFETNGYSVLRFWNHDVIKNIEGVLQKIQCYLEENHVLTRKQ
jgi:very-short-patch-repair endonuclease